MKDKLQFNTSNKFVLWIKNRKLIIVAIFFVTSILMIPVTVEFANKQVEQPIEKIELKELTDNLKILHDFSLNTKKELILY